jgi:hypothetical protein
MYSKYQVILTKIEKLMHPLNSLQAIYFNFFHLILELYNNNYYYFPILQVAWVRSYPYAHVVQIPNHCIKTKKTNAPMSKMAFYAIFSKFKILF